MADPAVLTAAEVLERAARAAPSTVAVASPDGRELRYAQLISRGRQLGRWLLGAGLEPGDRVALWLTDVPEHIELYVACTLAGLVVVPVNARYTEHEAEHIVRDSGARLLICSEPTAERADRLAARLESVRVVRLTGHDPVAGLAGGLPAGPLPSPRPDQLLVLGYTSGTTGRPKGAMLTQASVAAIARMNALAYRLPTGSVIAMTGSMAFVAVVPAHIFSHFFVRGTVRLLGAWTVSSLIDEIDRHAVTFTYVPTPLLDEFAAAATRSRQRLASLTSVLHSASKAVPGKLERLAAVLGGGRVIEGWGMTENSGGLMTATGPGDAWPGSGRFGTAGRAVPEVEISVMDETGRPVPHDGETLGELVFRSPALFTGYWGLAEVTRNAFRDGWFHSGDLGSIDPQGYVTIVERRQDLIVSGGMNVYPFEVEQVLVAHPGVAAACVVGIPHERWGQSVAAVVVRAEGVQAEAEELLAHCREFLAGYKKPTAIVFVDALPLTQSLKVSRSAVKASLIA